MSLCEAYEAFLKRSVEVTHPLAKASGQISTPEDVADLVAFLVSDEARFITGDCTACHRRWQAVPGCLGAWVRGDAGKAGLLLHGTRGVQAGPREREPRAAKPLTTPRLTPRWPVGRQGPPRSSRQCLWEN